MHLMCRRGSAMLSPETMKLVKSTSPILKVKGQQITECFYRQLFEAYPGLLDIFNVEKIQQGKQQSALAFTLYQAAENIDQLEEILPVVRHIAHKHKSLQVKPEHYPIVGKYLLKSMKEVLGNTLTEEMINAWKEAYDVIASVFINIENKLYTQDHLKEGSWEGFKPFKVVKKQQESEDMVSLYLRPEDDSALPVFLPGQYVSIQVSISDETHMLSRQYSLSDTWNKEYYRISVKKEGKGKVSSFIHEHIKENDLIQCSVPAGQFVLDKTTDKSVYFISRGSGITPMMTMAKALAESNSTRNVTFVYEAKSAENVPFQQEMNEFIEKLEHGQIFQFYKGLEIEGEQKPHAINEKLDDHQLHSIVKDNEADFYVCGPKPFLQSVLASLTSLGVKQNQVYVEGFNSSFGIKC